MSNVESENIDIIENLHNSQPPEKRPRFSHTYTLSDSDIPSTSSSIVCDEIEDTNIDSNDGEANIHNDIITNILKTSDVTNFNLKNLLNNHIIGRAILLKYEKTNSIDNKDRNNLCDIIVCQFLNEGKRLNNSTISILADKIVEIFKEEKRSTYYVSPISKRKSRHNKPEIARGKLIDKHRNKLTIIKKNLVAARSYTEEAKQGKFLLYY